MSKETFIIACLIFFIGIKCLEAQIENRFNFITHHYSIADGISHKQVNQTFRDSRGFLWLATPNGLNVFDGRRAFYATYWPYLSSPREVLIRAEDHMGLIWVKFNKGGNNHFKLFDIRTRNEYALAERIDTVLLGLPVDVISDSKGDLILINHRAELWKEDGGKKWRKIATSLEKFNSFSDAKPSEDFIWLTTENALFYQPQKVDIISVSNSGVISKALHFKDFLFSTGGPDGSILIFCESNLVFLYPGGKLTKLSYSQIPGGETILDYFFFADFDPVFQNLWVWHRDYLRLYRLETTANMQHKFNLLGEHKLVLTPADMNTTKNGGLVVSALDGLFVTHISPNYFTNHFHVTTPGSSRSQMQEARGILETTDGSLFFSVGLYVYQKRPKESGYIKLSTHKSGITYLTEDTINKSIWFGGLYNYDLKSKQVTKYVLPVLSSGELTWSATNIDTNTILLGTSSGLIEFSKKDGISKKFNAYNQFFDLKTSAVYHFGKAENEKWWILAESGLYTLESGKGITAKYGSLQPGKYFLPADNFRHFFRDDHGIYWFATSQGLLKWNKSSGASELLTTAQGLPNNNLYAVYGDKNGHLWMSSDKGIIRYQPETGAIRVFLEEDGISNNEFNRISHLQAKDGTLYFGSINGITSFHPDDFVHAENKPTPYDVKILAIKAISNPGNRERELQINYFTEGKLSLPPNVHTLHFEYSLPDYHKSIEVTYRYRIDGLQDNWVYTKANQLQLFVPSPGNYTLNIEAISGTGLVSRGACKIPFRVLPPFYLTSWFLLSGLAVSILIVLALLRYRVRLLKAQQVILEEKIRVGTLQISRDKELIERQAEMLRHQNEAQRRFFANITHEFRTPLSLVLGPVDVLHHQTKLSPRFKSLLTIARDNSRRVLELVDSILTISSLDAQQFRRRDEPLKVNEFLYALSEEYRITALQKQVSLYSECEFSPDTLVLTDQRILRIMLNNLVSNAIKFTPSQGSVWVKVAPDDDKILINVKDNGRGIPPDDLPRIFDRYFQTTSIDSPLEGGTGIGLSLVKELVDMLNGTISAESTIGLGSSFSIVLPLIYAREEIGAVKDLEKPANETGNTKLTSRLEGTILLVEDNPDYRKYLDFFLAEKYRVQYAGNGREALDKLKSGFLPDLIITDWMMPELDGFQLAVQLKSGLEWSHIPIVFLTARSAPEDLTKVMRLGVDDYLIKPIEESALFTVLRKILERHQKRKLAQGQSPAEDDEQQSGQDQEWLQKLESETLNGLSDELFSVDVLASKMLMGRSSFYKKVRRLTGLTPNEYILEARLVRARHLMETRPDLTLKKVVQMVGLKAKHNFSKAFRARFGRPPTWYLD